MSDIVSMGTGANRIEIDTQLLKKYCLEIAKQLGHCDDPSTAVNKLLGGGVKRVSYSRLDAFGLSVENIRQRIATGSQFGNQSVYSDEQSFILAVVDEIESVYNLLISPKDMGRAISG